MTNTLRRFLPWQSFNEFFVSVVYFVQGSAGLTAIAASLILREELGLDFQQIGMMSIASTLPWTIKPLFGLLTDLVPIGKFRRRPYLHIGPLIGFVGYLLVGLYGHDFQSFFLALLFANLGLGLTDVATDGFVVEESDEDNAARIQGITQASIRIAAFVTSFFSGLLIYAEIFTPHQMYLVLATFPLITFACSFFITERPADDIKLFEQKGEDSISTESSLEQYRTKQADLKLLTPGFTSTLIIIFTLIVSNVVFSAHIDAWFAEHLPSLSRAVLTTGLWFAFGGWMWCYFSKLRRLNLTTSMIFVALAFILLWRINPGTGSSMFFYVKDTLEISEKTIGFISTVGQLGSVLGVLLAVKYFDRFSLKKLLLWTVILGGLFGLSSFAITRPEWGAWIGGFAPLSWLGMILAFPVYFFESLFNLLITGGTFTNPFASVGALSALERFLFIQGITEELIFMIAFIPLLKFAVLITPSRAEATNFAIITSVMNVGLALSKWISGYLYNTLMGVYHPDLEVTSIQVDVIEILIWINIITTFTCLIILPWLKTTEFEKIKKG